MLRSTFALFAAALALSGSSCASDPASFRVERAPGWGGGARTVSILGIYKDGRMSAESWDELGNRFSSPFAEPRCDAGFGDALHAADPDRYQRFEDQAMSEGMTDALIDGLAPAAQADYVVVFQIFGRTGGLPQTTPTSRPPPRQTASPMAGMSGRRGGMGMGRSTLPGGDDSFPLGRDDIPIEMAASIFSVKEHRSVAEISMKFSGKDADEALNRFTKQLELELRGAKCIGWTFTPAAK